MEVTSYYARRKWLALFIILASVSFYATLHLPYVGEEAVYTISSYEMWFSHHYLVNTLYGYFYGRPPLLNWLIIPLSNLVGWGHMLLASRFVSATATILVAWLTFWFVKRITVDKHFALLCAAVYLTGDLLFVRGWLAYADPLLSLFIFASIIFLWLGVEEKRSVFFVIGVIALSAGFLTKALSPYWFYGLAGLVLLVFHKNRLFLLRLTSIVVHFFALTIPFLWNHFADPRYFHAMWYEATNTAFSPTIGKYMYTVLVTQPLMLLLRLAPISLIAAYYYFKKIKGCDSTAFRTATRIAFWIALSNFAVCWFAPRWPEARYYMPVLPFMAMCLAYVVWNAGEKALKITGIFLLVTLALKAAYIGAMYYKYEHFEPDYKAEAQDVIKRVGDTPIYADKYSNQSSPVLKVASYVDLLRYPAAPLGYQPDDYWGNVLLDATRIFTLPYNYPPMLYWNNGFMLGQLTADRDTLVKAYSKGKRRVDLFCRGTACLNYRNRHRVIP